jgi:hypothetical protein
MNLEQTAIRTRGKSVIYPSIYISERTVITTGKWIKIASVPHEDLVEGETLTDPEAFVQHLKRSKLKADLFTFAQRLPHTEPAYHYYIEWENVAALPITTYTEWLKDRVEYSVRKAVNKAKRLGIVVKVAEFNDQLVEGIRRIYEESPVRQGKAFWHYKKDFQTLKTELGDYRERSVFLAAYFGDELIGTMKMIYVDSTAPIMQIFCASRHFDKRPNNALIAKAVEVCEQERKTHLIYGNFVYNDHDSSLTEFKRRSGFEPIALPHYFIPLTLKGRIALKLGLHRGIAANTPEPLLKLFLKARRVLAERRLHNSQGKVAERCSQSSSGD